MSLASAFSGVPAFALVLLGLALLVSAVGFRRLVYFISIGYGFSITAMAVAAALFYGLSGGVEPSLGSARGPAPLDFALAALLALYGLRLGIFIILRERQASFREAQIDEGWGEGGLGMKFGVWISVSLLYVAMFMPALSRFARAAAGGVDSLPLVSALGVAVCAAGLLLESAADFQKSAFKKRQPKRFCDVGLFRMVRSPNYFGEILVWTGALVSALGSFSGPLAWILAIVGWACIVLIMVGSARRLELSQEKRYGDDPSYRDYTATVPILFPLVPIHSLKNAKLYLG